MTTTTTEPVAVQTALDAALAALTPERSARMVSPTVARQALFVLLGDNDNWAEKPVGRDLDVWNSILRSRDNESLAAELGALFPDHAEVMKHHMKHWALDWLRDCATVDRLDTEAGE